MSHGQDFVTQNVGLRRQAMSFEYLRISPDLVIPELEFVDRGAGRLLYLGTLESKTFPLRGPGKLRS